MNPSLERLREHLRELNEEGLAETPAAILALVAVVAAGMANLVEALTSVGNAIACGLPNDDR